MTDEHGTSKLDKSVAAVTVLADAELLPAVVDFVRKAANQLGLRDKGLRDKAAEHLDQAVETVCRNVIDHAFEPDEEGRYDVYVLRRPGARRSRPRQHRTRRSGRRRRSAPRAWTLDTLPRLVAEGRGPFDLIFIDADKPSNPDYFARALELSRRGSLIIADNVVRDGAVVDAASGDPKVQGIRRFNGLLAGEPRVSATAIQTVGSKGYDGFAIALVAADQ